MAESGEQEHSGIKINITVKTPKEKKDIELTADGTVKELREATAAAFEAKEEQLCLIFAGKILKDPESLEDHLIKDGMTVHLVIKSNRQQPSPAAAEPATTTSTTRPSQPTNVGATPFGLGNLGGLQGLGGMGMGSANFMDMQQRMQREVMSNPETLRQMMDNPMVQQLMSNPDVMRQLITANPQMRELMERNPEITHMLNNPELMRQTMELARNPNMLQELMRTQDRAMSNLESIPGGFNALQRMYRDIQEPMMNAATDGFSSNPFAALANNSGSTSDSQQGRENTAPLPNPWAAAGSGTDSTTDTTTSTTAPPTGQAGMFNSPGMQSLMEQVTQNPQLMQNMMQAPYMQTMMQSMAANPDMAQQIVGSNPMFAGNPQLQDYMNQMMPTFLQQMQNPEMQGLVGNPRAMQAIMQIQQGMQQLQTEAPTVFNSMGIPGMSMPPTTTPGTTPSATSTSTSTEATTTTTTSPAPSPATPSSPTATTNSTTPAGTTPNTGQPGQPDALTNFMSQMVQMMGSGQNLNQPPEQRYAAQLEQLSGMGFIDRQANLQALTATLGDVNAAIDRLVQRLG